MEKSFAGNKLKQLRQQMGWSQADLADRIGVSGSVVSMYESGLRAPARDTLLKIGKAFNISMDELLYSSDRKVNYSMSSSMLDKGDDQFGLLMSMRMNNNNEVQMVKLVFRGSQPVLSIDDQELEFSLTYSDLSPQVKISVCEEMLRRAKDELLKGV